MQTFEILCKRLKKFGEKIVEKTLQMLLRRITCTFNGCMILKYDTPGPITFQAAILGN